MPLASITSMPRLNFKRCANYSNTNHVILAITFLLAMLLSATPALGKGVYQTGPDFIAEYFPQQQPLHNSLWLTPELKQSAAQIIGKKVRGIRMRYWQDGYKTGWIMDEIGKELPITIGVIINNSQVEAVKILAFRESRGWEVRYPAFTSQYQHAKLTADQKLDLSIDGITGATLSVRAVTKVVRLALFYHQQAMLLNQS